MYYELLKLHETVNADVYRYRLNILNDVSWQTRSAVNRRKDISLHDNAKPHFAKVVNDTLLQFPWEALLHAMFSPNIALSGYHSFRSMQLSLAGKRFPNAEEMRK